MEPDAYRKGRFSPGPLTNNRRSGKVRHHSLCLRYLIISTNIQFFHKAVSFIHGDEKSPSGVSVSLLPSFTNISLLYLLSDLISQPTISYHRFTSHKAPINIAV
jgi:hypothetical protein